MYCHIATLQYYDAKLWHFYAFVFRFIMMIVMPIFEVTIYMTQQDMLNYCMYFSPYMVI